MEILETLRAKNKKYHGEIKRHDSSTMVKDLMTAIETEEYFPFVMMANEVSEV